MRDRKNDSTHRRAAEAKIGRKLKPDEDVHHRDDDKTNQAAANLEVTAHGAHTAHSNRTRPIAKLRKALRAYHEKRKAY